MMNDDDQSVERIMKYHSGHKCTWKGGEIKNKVDVRKMEKTAKKKEGN